jgi:hypothetical protein
VLEEGAVLGRHEREPRDLGDLVDRDGAAAFDRELGDQPALAIDDLGDDRRLVVLDGVEGRQVAHEKEVERDRAEGRAHDSHREPGEQDPDAPSLSENHGISSSYRTVAECPRGALRLGPVHPALIGTPADARRLRSFIGRSLAFLHRQSAENEPCPSPSSSPSSWTRSRP